MATVAEKYPFTLEERLALGREEQRFEGTFEDFVQLAEVCEYPVEFYDGTILAMSIASDHHEQIVANILGVFFVSFKGNPEYKRYGSNRHVYIPAASQAYSPDASMVKGEPEVFEYSKGKTANLNPWLVVEILSESTRTRDYGVKFGNYKKIDSLQYMLFIEQDKPMVTLFSRIDDTTRWESTDYNEPEHEFHLAGKAIQLADIYEDVVTKK